MSAKELIEKIDKLLISDCAFVEFGIEQDGWEYLLSITIKHYLSDDSTTTQLISEIKGTKYSEIKALGEKLHNELSKHYHNQKSVIVSVMELINDNCEEE